MRWYCSAVCSPCSKSCSACATACSALVFSLVAASRAKLFGCVFDLDIGLNLQEIGYFFWGLRLSHPVRIVRNCRRFFLERERVPERVKSLSPVEFALVVAAWRV